LEVNFLQLIFSCQQIIKESFKGFSKLLSKMTQNLVMPRIILRVNLIEHKPIINDDWTKWFLSLTVIKCSSILSYLV